MSRKCLKILLISIFLHFACSEELITNSSDEPEVKIEHHPVVYNASSIDDFPPDLFTNEQRQHGALAFHLLAAIYFFTLLAVVCSDYFIPSVECVCEDLNIPKDVAAATFMAGATMAPEVLANIISTFVAESDVGMGGVLGALLFNVLGVAACAGMATSSYLQLDWWPITRDSILYTSTVSLLIAFTWDGKITLIESATMVGLVVIYFTVLIQNRRIMHCMTWLMEINFNCCRLNSYDMPASFVESNLRNAIQLDPEDMRRISNTSEKSKNLHGSLSRSSVNDSPIFMIYADAVKSEPNENQEKKPEKSLWHFPISSGIKTFWWFYTWPIKFVLTLTIPNPKTYRRLYPLTFVMCIVWIALNSYMVIWMLTVIGYTLSIPEAIMGLTFLAAGNCTPEAISSVLMILKGENGVGVSNSLGSSSLDVLMSLGLPWLIRNLLNWNDSGHHPYVELDHGIGWTAFLLLISVVSLYIVFSLAKYRLQRSVGVTLFIIYFILITFSVLLEMNIFHSSDS